MAQKSRSWGSTLTGDTKRQATSSEVAELDRNRTAQAVVAELLLNNRVLEKSARGREKQAWSPNAQLSRREAGTQPDGEESPLPSSRRSRSSTAALHFYGWYAALSGSRLRGCKDRSRRQESSEPHPESAAQQVVQIALAHPELSRAS